MKNKKRLIISFIIIVAVIATFLFIVLASSQDKNGKILNGNKDTSITNDDTPSNTDDEPPILSNNKSIISIKLGGIINGNNISLKQNIILSEFLSGLTIPDKATVVILDSNGNKVSHETTTYITSGITIRIIAEDGTTKDYTVIIEPDSSESETPEPTPEPQPNESDNSGQNNTDNKYTKPSVSFTTATQSSTDEKGTMTITAKLSKVSKKGVVIPFTISSSSTATVSTDYSMTSSPVIISAGATTANITITIAEDSVDEKNETIIVNMGNPTNATKGAITTHTATITDDDAPPTVSFTTSSQSSIDEKGTMTITAELSSVSGYNVIVPFTINGTSTATDTNDYNITTSPATISAGSKTANITLTIVEDSFNEFDETVVIDMGTPTNATKGAITTHTATITDDDLPNVTFTSSSQTSIDETGTKTITLQLSSVSSDDVTIPFTINGASTATDTADYSITSSPVTISAGSTTTDINISISGDSLDEPNETIIVDMGTPTNANQGAITTHTVTITDDDAPPTVSFTASSQTSASETGTMTIIAELSSASGYDVTIPFSINGASTATDIDDYSITLSPLTISAGSTTTDITISISGDSLDESNETIIVDMGAPINATQGVTTTHTATIADDDNPPTVSFTASSQTSASETGTMTITAELSSVSCNSVTIPFSIDGASTATGGGVDYTITASPITINAGSTTANINITINDDSLDEVDESVIINMGTPTNATQGATTTHTATITDDEVPPTVSFTSASQTNTSETGTITITAQLSFVSGNNVTVPFSINGASTATSGADYTITASPITINAGSTTANITITISGDSSDEPNETIIVDMGTPTNATKGATTTHTATINDDDARPTVSFTSTSQSSAGETGTMTITAQLSNTSGYNVTVPFTISGTATNGVDYTITASPLTIPAGSSTRSITVTITGDSDDESDETIIVNMGTPTNATKGATVTHTATITDDDGFPVSYTVSGSLKASENGVYNRDGDYNGKPQYTNTYGHHLLYGSKWELFNIDEGEDYGYGEPDSSPYPPEGLWWSWWSCDEDMSVTANW